jgi:uncharacterized membrane protein
MSENPDKVLDERIEKAFDYAADATKQILTLSTAVISATVLLSRDYVRALPFFTKASLVFSWFVYLFSAFCGVWTLLALTGTLERSYSRNSRITLYAPNIQTPLLLQIFSFLLATLLVIMFGIQLIAEQPSSPPSISVPTPSPSISPQPAPISPPTPLPSPSSFPSVPSPTPTSSP